MKRLVLLAAFVAGFAPALARADGVSALRAADSGNWSQARMQTSGDAVARDVVTWMYLTSDKTRASFPEIAAFVTKHPEWPSADKLFKVAETRLPDDLSDGQILAWFGRNPPVSAVGMQRYMAALLRARQTQAALSTLKNWWVDANITADEQAGIIATYGQYLSTADHVRRLERMLGDKQYTPARALAPIAGRGYMELVEARVALQSGDKSVDVRVRQIPRGLLNDTGLLLSRVQYRRENKDDSGAIALLNTAPPAGRTTDPSAWWKERYIIARRMFEAGRYREAYKLAANHGLPSAGSDFAAAEFYAGFLALRYTNQPYAAFEHFEKLYNNTSTPISRARGAYWAGRASEAMKSRDVALQWYQVAARYQTTFYGQEAARHINLPLDLIRGDKPVVSAQQKAAFDNKDIVQAVRLLHRAGMSRERSQFLRAMIKQAQTPQDFSLLSDFAVSIGQVDVAVKVAKDAEKTGLYLVDYAFPTIMHTVNGVGADPALVHALIRQESQFDPNAVSSSGALGLMQIMPATGRETAKKNGLMHNTAWLTGKPQHNVQVGAFYIQELINRFDGSLPLAIAGYNAGPGRVRQWLTQFGDPRTGQVEMIDWMETIPIYETRNYVQRVLEGYAVYKAKLAQRRGTTDMRGVHTAYNP